MQQARAEGLRPDWLRDPFTCQSGADAGGSVQLHGHGRDAAKRRKQVFTLRITPNQNHLSSNSKPKPLWSAPFALTSNLWWRLSQAEEEQTAGQTMRVEATGSPMTSPQQRGVFWGTESKRKQGELPQPFQVPANWAGSDCSRKRNVEND